MLKAVQLLVIVYVYRREEVRRPLGKVQYIPASFFTTQALSLRF